MFGLGSQSQLGIGIALTLHNNFSRQAQAVNQQLMAMRRNANAALTSAMQQYRNQSMMVAAGASALSMGMYRMVDAAADYDHLINQIAIVGGKQLGKSRKDLDQFAQSMSQVFPNKPREVAAAMFENVKAGVTEGLELITKYQVAVSTATNEAIQGEQGVAAGLLGIKNAMDLSLGEFPRIANAVSQAANISMASVTSINESMQYFANTAHAANIDLETTLALIAKLSQSNIRGSIAGTSLSNMIRHLVQAAGPFAGPKKKAAWDMLGVDATIAKGLVNQARIVDLVMLVDKASRKLDYVTKENVFNQIFGVRGEKALINLFGSNDPAKTLTAMRDAIVQGVKEDVAMKQARAMSNDTWSDLKKIGNAFARFGIKFLKAAEPTIRVLFGIVTRVIDAFSWIISTPVGKVLAGIAVVAAPLIAIMFAFRAAVLTAIIAMRGFAMSSAVGGFGALSRGGMGLIGMGRFGAAGGAFTRNAAGRYTVAAGQTISWAGKTYKGGQLLPQAYMASRGIGAGATMWSRVALWGGRALGFLGRLSMIGTGIWLGVEILKGIFGNTKKKEERAQAPLDMLTLAYYRDMDTMHWGSGMSNAYYDKYRLSRTESSSLNGQQTPFQQNLNINMDGQNVFNKQINTRLGSSLDAQMDFEIPGY